MIDPVSFIAVKLVRWGLSQRVAEKLAPPVLFAGLLLCAALLAALAALAVHLHDKGVIEEHEQQRELRSIDARDGAADQRARDVIGNYEMERELRDAIEAAPESDAPLHPAIVALNCQRLRRAGIQLPPACGPAGGDGSEARSVRRDSD